MKLRPWTCFNISVRPYPSPPPFFHSPPREKNLQTLLPGSGQPISCPYWCRWVESQYSVSKLPTTTAGPAFMWYGQPTSLPQPPNPQPQHAAPHSNKTSPPLSHRGRRLYEKKNWHGGVSPRFLSGHRNGQGTRQHRRHNTKVSNAAWWAARFQGRAPYPYRRSQRLLADVKLHQTTNLGSLPVYEVRETPRRQWTHQTTIAAQSLLGHHEVPTNLLLVQYLSAFVSSKFLLYFLFGEVDSM